VNYDSIINSISKMNLEELSLLSRNIQARREQIVLDRLQRGEMKRPSEAVMILHRQGQRIEAIKSYRTEMHDKGQPITLMESKLIIDATAGMGQQEK